MSHYRLRLCEVKFLKSSREATTSAGSDVGEDEAQEFLTGDVAEMTYIVYQSTSWG